MARKFRNIRGVTRQVRETSWIGLGGTEAPLAGTSTAVLAAGFSATTLSLRPFTIVRTHVYLSVASDQQLAVESFQMAYGHAIVSDQAFAIGVTAVPTPQTDHDSDLWMVHQWIGGRLQFATAAGFGEYSKTVEIDSKAMRKVEEGQDIAIVIESGSGSEGMRVFKAGRLLIKLH